MFLRNRNSDYHICLLFYTVILIDCNELIAVVKMLGVNFLGPVFRVLMASINILDIGCFFGADTSDCLTAISVCCFGHSFSWVVTNLLQ